ncbi:tRNA (N6-isopentenyl adenosine(37)-C2)-methylthiotransferase MiaB [Buchnera aphidicola]|uniref:tRNA-2-methylthio-N(6)-dimethylallyladenosine synthase n=1 Tax=Buchnera aphidicola subsp. Cinara cedri (strain Cc) TaxID=372461 RepID=MIAB_BUCCC|nr:RecName: Full=tRNA-2-methylthio-N(6)-dimethylallyladenosine synthase; AltName: Full=(Dimethylallyl)adenosine tRNA methylthiotransferase MiaB; AltName: Full=tRNA-i(6)A37 methylthiotransferase [Buchnera aphidicola BCc]ABJ90734.1 bifunctional enzyme involved in thiolation and methylation of tRNA [Buchnera aphidicola BCc]
MNEHDSSIIENILKKTNLYIITKKPEISDILILNTCSIREKAQEKLFHQLGRWKKLKQKNSKILIAVGGCVAVQEGKKIYKRAKFIDIIFGPQTLHKLPKLLIESNKKKSLIINIKKKSLKKFNYTINKNTNIKKKFSSFVTIMEGCNKYCSFCIVPYTRGKEVSRNNKKIISEIIELSKKGVREITLLGQNVNAYKFSDTFNKKNYSFSDLLYSISEIPRIDRIRFITSHPVEFNNNIIEAYKKIPKLTNFLHLPVQSGSNKILKLMKRGYTIEKYENIVNKIKKIRPKINISSDFIIGFPGETKEDFQKTIYFISKINFDTSYSFIYSKRPRTRASKLEDNVTMEEKKKRLYKVQQKINQQAFQWKRRSTEQIVLVEGISKNNIQELYGRTENNRTVFFEGNPKFIGNFIKLKIISIKYNTFLKGKIISNNYF